MRPYVGEGGMAGGLGEEAGGRLESWPVPMLQSQGLIHDPSRPVEGTQ